MTNVHDYSVKYKQETGKILAHIYPEKPLLTVHSMQDSWRLTMALGGPSSLHLHLHSPQGFLFARRLSSRDPQGSLPAPPTQGHTSSHTCPPRHKPFPASPFPLLHPA